MWTTITKLVVNQLQSLNFMKLNVNKILCQEPLKFSSPQVFDNGTIS
jgi:hypothetical protein